MCSKIQQFVPLVVVATMFLASGVVMVPAAMAADGEPYLQMNEGQVLWQESTASGEVVVSAELVDDLDGDGLMDVLVQSSEGASDNQTQTAIAKKGSDGTHLWEESITGVDVYMHAEAVGDLDGDGLPDVLVWSSVGPPDNQTQTVIGEKGSDGTHLWEESISGQNAYINPEVVGDLDGDGLPDVIVDSYVGPEDSSTGMVIAKRGINGTHLWEESITGLDAHIYGEVVEDLDGDDLLDVLVRSEVGPDGNQTTNLTAKKGSNGNHLWEESVTGEDADIGAEIVGDLDGDDLPDVLVWSSEGASDNQTQTVIAKMGTNGTHLWEESITGVDAYMYGEVVGDLDGDSLPDVLVRSWKGSFDNQTQTVIAKTGSNGTHLWEESVMGYDASIQYDVVGDLDGDHLPDVMVKSEVGPYGSVTLNLTAKKGSNGNHLWEESFSGSYFYIEAEVVGDLEGDGLPDVLIECYAEDTDTETLVAKKGSNGTDLWEEFAPSGYFNFIEGKVVGDQDGDGLPDVLVRIQTGPLENQTATVIAKTGSNGTHLWEESITCYDASLWDNVVPDLDGDGLLDVMIRLRMYPPSYTLIAKKISDGTHLWEESNTESDAYMEAWAVADLDGDSLPDVLVQTKGGSGSDRVFSWIAKKGSDGTHLWQEVVSGDDAYTDMQAEGVAADFDGDGLPDVLVKRRTGSAENQIYTAIGKKGSDGTYLWEAESNEEISLPSLEGEGDEAREPLFYDLNGDGKADALVWISNQVCAVSVGEEAPLPPQPLPGAVPSVTRWGIIGMIAAFSLLLALMVRRRLAGDRSTER